LEIVKQIYTERERYPPLNGHPGGTSVQRGIAFGFFLLFGKVIEDFPITDPFVYRNRPSGSRLHMREARFYKGRPML
jgi:hypothetical protein